jgi:invasion protein IalB
MSVATLMGRPFVTIAMMAMAVVIASHAFAQQPPAQPKAPAQKDAPKAGAPKQQQPPQQQQQQQQQQPQLTYSPWTKICPKGTEANAKKVCFTGRDARVETGIPVVAAVLIEPEGEPRKLLRITLPLGMALQPGTRLVVDQGQPITAPFVICLQNGCMADYEVSQELINNMKKGSGLILQAINGGGQPISITLPLAEFAKTYDGPPMSEADFEKLQKSLAPKQGVN